LTNTANPVSCGLTLNRRAQISGRVLQVLAVTVNYDESHATKANHPAAFGTSVYVDGLLAGITGGSSEVSQNGLVIFLQPDATHDIYAMDASGDTSPVSQFYAESWGIDNLTLKIE
jgi:hypothetical protein